MVMSAFLRCYFSLKCFLVMESVKYTREAEISETTHN